MLGAGTGVPLKEPNTDGTQPLRKAEKLEGLTGLGKETAATAS